MKNCVDCGREITNDMEAYRCGSGWVCGDCEDCSGDGEE